MEFTLLISRGGSRTVKSIWKQSIFLDDVGFLHRGGKMPSRHLHRSALRARTQCVYVLISTLITMFTCRKNSVLSQKTWFGVNTCKQHNPDSLPPK